MNTFKKIILFLFGIVLLVFGNKAAISAISDTDKVDKEKEDEPKKTSGGFEIMKAGDSPQMQAPTEHTVIETDSTETASGSE